MTDNRQILENRINDLKELMYTFSREIRDYISSLPDSNERQSLKYELSKFNDCSGYILKSLSEMAKVVDTKEDRRML